jgi:predicted Rossmann fold nucleotide-binding protein DprA/Smf involved in DNA uptake
MARNPIIYGLAKEIYVAESKPSKNRQGKETKGGTYSGVMDGLKKGRIIYVRQPDASEKNDNNYLIGQGAVAVDFEGNKVTCCEEYKQKEMSILLVAEAAVSYASFPDKIKQLLSKRKLTIKEIHTKLNFEKSEQVLKKELEKLEFIEIRKEKNKNYFSLKERKEQMLF